MILQYQEHSLWIQPLFWYFCYCYAYDNALSSYSFPFRVLPQCHLTMKIWAFLGMDGVRARAILSHLRFWKGICKVASWIGLEILIPKHPWKSQIGLLQPILAAKRYVSFFWVTLYLLLTTLLLSRTMLETMQSLWTSRLLMWSANRSGTWLDLFTRVKSCWVGAAWSHWGSRNPLLGCGISK